MTHVRECVCVFLRIKILVKFLRLVKTTKLHGKYEGKCHRKFFYGKCKEITKQQ